MKPQKAFNRDTVLQLISCKDRGLIRVEGEDPEDAVYAPWGRVIVRWPAPENHKWVGAQYYSRAHAEAAARELAAKLFGITDKANYKEIVAEWFTCQ